MIRRALWERLQEALWQAKRDTDQRFHFACVALDTYEELAEMDERELLTTLRIRLGQYQDDLGRLRAQAQSISVWLSEAGCPAMPIDAGVRWLKAERDAALARAEAASDEAQSNLEAWQKWQHMAEQAEAAIAAVRAALVWPDGAKPAGPDAEPVEVETRLVMDAWQAEIARLQRELAHWRSQTVSEPATIALMEADAELARERAAHAETRRERDALKKASEFWSAHDTARTRLAAATELLREALAAHDRARQIVKEFTDAERGGDYLVADAEWATRARAFLA